MFCAKCGTDMSDNATACPKCGEPTKNAKPATQKKSHGCAIGCLSVIVLLGILGVGGWLIENDPDVARMFSELCGDASESKDALSQRLIGEGLTYVGSEKYDKIVELFSSNEFAAEKEWVGKRVFVKIEVTEVSSKVFGGLDIDGTISPIQIVRCTFKNMGKDTAAQIRKGQKLTISGKVRTSTTLLGVGALQLDDCKIEE